jgi:hypothetical protein
MRRGHKLSERQPFGGRLVNGGTASEVSAKSRSSDQILHRDRHDHVAKMIGHPSKGLAVKGKLWQL